MNEATATPHESPDSRAPRSSSPAPAGSERRIFDRRAIEVEIGVYSDSNFYTGFTEDISEGGLFAATYDLVPIGSSIDVEFTLPGGHQVKVTGEVRWLRDPIEDDTGAPPGMGIRFVELGSQDHAAISEFVCARTPMFFIDDDS